MHLSQLVNVEAVEETSLSRLRTHKGILVGLIISKQAINIYREIWGPSRGQLQINARMLPNWPDLTILLAMRNLAPQHQQRKDEVDPESTAETNRAGRETGSSERIFVGLRRVEGSEWQGAEFGG